jgi:F5/8 type C domain
MRTGNSGPRRSGPDDVPGHGRRGRLRARPGAGLLACAATALVTILGLVPLVGAAAPASAAPTAAAAAGAATAETALSETGWTASSNTSSAGDPPSNAIDGNINTRFSSDTDEASGQYFQVNLGSAQTFNQIEMDSGGSAGDYARGYNVEVSTDGTNFTSVATGTGTASPEIVTFASQTAQYIRVVSTAASTTSWWSIAEFTVYSGTATAETALSETGWTATSNTSSAGDPPSNAIDGNINTRFSSDTPEAVGQYFQVNLGSAQTFNQIKLDSGPSQGDYARGYNVEVSTDGTNFTSVATGTSTSSPETVTFASQTAQYIRVVITASGTTNWWSIAEFTVYTNGSTGTGGGGTAPPTGGSLGSNVIVFTPSMSQSSIQSQLNTIANNQVPNQFGTARYALLFEPGTYGSSATPLDFTVGFYTEIAGLGQNPSAVVINGAINSFNQCPGGDQTNCNATDNFWRSMSNLTLNVMGNTGCYAGDDFWAVSQAAPMRRVQINGNLSLMDYCTGSPDFASGGFIADSRFTGGTITNGSQQQFITRNSSLDGWSNSVWNQVFVGDTGSVPAQSFASNSGDSGGPSSYTTLATSPVTEEEPYLYTDSSGNYNVFVPSLQTNSSGPTWTASSNTAGTSLSVNSTFYIVNSASTVSQINAALAAGDNLLFTPGVYSYGSTINVTKADTKIIGLGFATLIPTSGNVTMSVADVSGVNISGLIFDAGPTSSPSLLQVGTSGSTVSHASDPVTIDDVFFRIGGAETGTAATAFIDNSNNSILDDVWSWRADHGAGAGSWTSDQSNTGLTVNGNNVTAYGLAVEHYQQDEVIWNGQGGEVIFFQNENPYEVPSQSAWMASATQDGYPAFFVPNSVTSFNGYGMGSYSFFNQGVSIENAMAFQAPDTAGVKFHDLLTVFLNGAGGIQSVINGTGAAVSSSFGGPSDVVSYP